MNCAKTTELMSEYIDGLLSPSVQVEFGLHLEECSRCAADVSYTRVMLREMAGLSTRGGGPDCWPGVRSRILERMEAPRRWWAWLVRPAALAPTIALIVVIAVLSFVSPSRDGARLTGNTALAEYKSYLAAYSQAQRRQPLNDPDVGTAVAELENASYVLATVDQ